MMNSDINKFILTEGELQSPLIAKMTHNSNIALIDENITLEKSLKTLQD